MTQNRAIYRGLGYGAIATLVMTLVMVTGMSTGVAPMPQPIPKAIAERVMGLFMADVPTVLSMITGLIAHFGYGAAAGAVFAVLFSGRTHWKTGLLWGVVLWIVMQIVVLPLIGWGLFGIGETGFPPKIAVGTGVLHMIYGGILGWGVGRST